MNNLQIDKRNGDVKYNDEVHMYWDNDGRYISVTTLIDRYTQPFDGDFWSSYKAVEKLLPASIFKLEKKQLLDTHKFNLKYFLDLYDFTENEFNAAKQDILDSWQKENAKSCERGTAIHASLEEAMYKNCNQELKKYGLGGKFVVNTNASLERENMDLSSIEKGVFPEFLIYRKSEDGKLKIAGQIDLLIKDGNDIYIFDYKTNKKLEDKSFFDNRTKKAQMMQYPLNNLMDCNKMHYTLQLSTYAWMVQKLNPAFVIKKLMLIHYDHQGNVTEHILDYLKPEVERMLRDYKRQSAIDAAKEKRKPIIF